MTAVALSHRDLNVGDENVARRVMVRARAIAPCIVDLDGDLRDDAIAILNGAAAEVPEAGSRRTRSMSRNGSSISFDLGGGIFTNEEIADLRSLCGSTSTGPTPLGSFPEAGIVTSMWPEKEAP